MLIREVAAPVIYTVASHGQNQPLQSHLKLPLGFVLARLTAVEIAQPGTVMDVFRAHDCPVVVRQTLQSGWLAPLAVGLQGLQGSRLAKSAVHGAL